MAIYNRNDYKTALPQLEKRIDGLLDFFYPIGCYFETSDTKFDPNKMWGGKWELETEGQVHISAGENYEVWGAFDNESDGGEAIHILNTDEMPSHSHTQDQHRHDLGAYKYGANYCTAGNRSGMGANPDADTTVYSSYSRPTIQATGGGLGHNNMQPYIIVNRWHRVK